MGPAQRPVPRLGQRLALCLGVCVSVTLGAARPALAQQRTPRASAMLSTTLVKLGGTARLTITVTDASSAEITRVPEIDGLSLALGAPVTTSLSKRLSSGRTLRKNSKEWLVVLRPERAGDFVIPPFELAVNGERVEVPAEPLELRVVTDLEGQRLGYFELVDPPHRVYEGQPFTFDLRFGWDRQLDIKAAHLRLPWWDLLPGVLVVGGAPRDLGGRWLELPLNRRTKVRAERIDDIEREGRTFVALRLRRSYIATRSRTLKVPQSTFEFGEIVERGFINDVKEYYSNLSGFDIEVVPVPEQGRPLGWTGAVGPLEAQRRVDRRDVDEGDSIELTVVWTGAANLEFFDPPDLARLDAFRGFRVLGVEDDHFGDERRVTYELVPTSSDVDEIPPVPLWTFDTDIEAYRTVETDPVAIRVRALERGPGLDDGGGSASVHDIRDIRSEPAVEETLARPGGGWLATALAGVPALWLLGRTLVRRRRGDPSAPRERRRRRAARALRRRLSRATDAGQQSRALHEFLAARSGEGDQAWLGRDPLAWREAAAVERARGLARQQDREPLLEEGAARDLAQLLADLDRCMWAGVGPDGGPGAGATVDPERIRAVADRLVKEGL